MTNTYIDPRASVHETARIGEHVYLGPGVQVGKGCVIQSGAVIGEDGFGYERTHPDARWTRKPHTFGVVLEPDVHVGAHAHIDRGSWRPTRIRQGARIDNGVHVAHNCEVGRDCVIVAHAMLGGSVKVCDGAWIGPSASINQRITIGARALIDTGSVVTRDVPENVTVRGIPARIVNSEIGVRDEM